jgi:hypothetical protein
VIFAFPQSIAGDLVRETFGIVIRRVAERKIINSPHMFEGSGFLGADFSSQLGDDQLRAAAQQVVQETVHQSELHPDAWPAVFIRDPKDTEQALTAVAGDRYSYRDLDDFTDLIGRTVQGAPQVAKIERKGVLPEQIYLTYVECGTEPGVSARFGGHLPWLSDTRQIPQLSDLER